MFSGISSLTPSPVSVTENLTCSGITVRQDDAAAIRVFTCVGEIVDQNLLEALGICMQDKMMIGCRDKSQLYPIVLSASDTLHDCSTYVVYVYICDIKPISARLIIGQLITSLTSVISRSLLIVIILTNSFSPLRKVRQPFRH